ncbi:phosphoenolpyruvate synthase (plasmid) [Photobacterium sp. DA100]|uniref:phosphoenolpyruvate synthase n=1 Tax=Photobacterium sp. DA100 TaxID=3027472 RepID=UPI00247A4BF1|nr:phosphoenolpyruvate synthase [Photobacterium sp. DA100]WEM44365.1 phosphoenolpyruvate synthase [Photobacterium sp. DA100]
MKKTAPAPLIYWYAHLSIQDIALVGGKNASLGEMYNQLQQAGIRVPNGFATSAQLFKDFLTQNQLDAPIDGLLASLNSGAASLKDVGQQIRGLISQGVFTDQQEQCIIDAYLQLEKQTSTPSPAVAVRSSATAEDLPEASFAGQQESYLNIQGERQVIAACKQCFASLYTDRAIVYRQEQGFPHQQVALSVGIQQMIESECAGVMFSLDTENGFPDVVMINGSWGLGETIVKGSVTPDKFVVYKPLLEQPGKSPIIEKKLGLKNEKMIFASGSHCDTPTVTIPTSEAERHALVINDEETLQLSRWAAIIERHYGCAMDMEWAKDSVTKQLFIVQARPETVEAQKSRTVLVNYKLEKNNAPVLLEGASVGAAVACGQTYTVLSPHDIDQFPEGAILVTERTDPDWVPIMKKAAGIITDSGGPTSHAAIVSRELKVPAIVGTEMATHRLSNGQTVTLSCAGGAVGQVYDGTVGFTTQHIDMASIPSPKTQVMINAAMPDGIFHWWQLPTSGIGLTRIEFIISSQIGVHPMALLHPEKITDSTVKSAIEQRCRHFTNPPDFFTDTLALGISKIAASQYPKPVIVRMSDFKSNEYRGLLGGEDFELHEENPMLGLRGASRYYHPRYREAFQLECQAIAKARNEKGFDNIIVMIPFCRTVNEADKVLNVMAQAGLERGQDGLQVYVMCEIPSNVILAERFAERFDGFSIGSNDLTQLVLGIDRDSAELKPMFDARDDAVKRLIEHVITVAHSKGCKVGICGQAPSDHPEFAQFLVACGIDSISLNPDSFAKGCDVIAKAEQSRDQET